MKKDPAFWCLALHTLPGVRMARVAQILDSLEQQKRGPEAFFQETPETWRKEFGLPAPVVSYLETQKSEHLQKTEALAQQLRQLGVWILSCQDPRFPRDLEALPYRVPLLYGHGPLDLLHHRPRIAFLNSRFIRPEAEAALRRAASAVFQDLRLAVVTSPFRTAYRACAEVAVAHGAPVILVGDRGILFLLQSPWVRHLKGPKLLLTPFAPEDVGTPGAGMVRDDLIGCLADVLVGFEVYEGGNMERQFREALKAGKTALMWQRKGSSLANPRLIQQGALPFATEAELVARLRDELGL